jgi:hypothetical protein
VHEAPERVRERQEEQDRVAPVLEVRLHAQGGGDEILVREHAALRRAGRAGGVDQGGEVFLLHVAPCGLDRTRVGRRVRAALGLERGELVEADDLAHRRRLRLDRRQLPFLRVVLDEREHRLGVREDVCALLRRARGIDADDDRADRHRGPVEQHPFEPRAGEHCHGVPAADSAREQPVRERVHAPCRVLPRDLAPAVAVLLEVGGHRRAQVEDVAPERRGRPRREGPVRCRSRG